MDAIILDLSNLEGHSNESFFHLIGNTDKLEQYTIKKIDKLGPSERRRHESANKFSIDNDLVSLVFDSGVIAIDEYSYTHNYKVVRGFFECLDFFKIVKCFVVDRELLKNFIKNNVTNLSSSNDKISESESAKQFNGLTHFGHQLGAQDILIHLSSKNDNAYVTYKVDGALSKEVYNLKNYKLGRAIVSSVYNSKSGTGTQIGSYDDVTSPQRKNINHTIFDDRGNPIAEYEYRFTKTVTSGPGEVLVVMRAQGIPKRLEQLGLEDNQVSRFMDAIGLISENGGASIISGQTGSGKSTTNYACLLALPRTCVVQTFEDPIEFTKPSEYKNITQNALNKSIGYQNQLGSIMQQAPDVLFLQEIRDAETAKFAIGIANTGHGLVTSLHAKNPFGIVERLADLCGDEIKSSLASPGILKVLSHQALVNKLCPHCSKTREELNDEELKAFMPFLTSLRLKTSKKVRFKNSAGCEHCADGEKGRVPVLESIFIDQTDLQFIADGNFNDWRDYRIKNGHRTIRARVADLVKSGDVCISRYMVITDD